MKIGKGDKVRFLDEVGEGIVIRVQDDNVLVRSSDGFERLFQADQLVVVESGEIKRKPPSPSFDPEEALKLKESFFKRNLSKPAQKNDPTTSVMEVDLHIHELLEDTRGLGNSEMLAIQMNHFRIRMEEAITQKIRKVILIHGVGNGVLRAAIRKALKEEYGLECYDASLSKYGFGATEVVVN